MKLNLFFLSFCFFFIKTYTQTTNFIDIKLLDTSRIKISGRTTVIGNTSNISSVNSNGYSNNYDKILFSVESGDPTISGQSVGGFLTPRMTTTQRNTIFNGTTINGTLIYNTTINGFEYYSTGNNSWVPLINNSFWNFIPNTYDFYNTNSGNIGIGTNTPRAKLEVNGATIVNDTFLTNGLNNFNNTTTLVNGDLNINNGNLTVSNIINVASNKLVIDNVGNVISANTITSTGNMSINDKITANKDITSTSGNINFGGKLISTNGLFNTTQLTFTGALPVSKTFTTKGGALLVSFSGTAYTSTAGKLIGIRISFDSNTTYDNAVLTANEANMHKTIPVRTILYKDIASGSHTINIKTDTTDTFTDANDFFYITISELPF